MSLCQNIMKCSTNIQPNSLFLVQSFNYVWNIGYRNNKEIAWRSW